MTKIDERKSIIDSLKSNYGEQKKGIEKRIQYLKGMTILYMIMTLISAGIIILSILSELFNFNFLSWQKTGLLAILSLSFVLRLPKDLYELKLLKHYKKISLITQLAGIDKLNSDLKNIINKLNKGFKGNWIVIVLTIIILMMGLWTMGFDNNTPYWNYMKIPIIVFYGIAVFRFIITYKKLTTNIDKTETE